MSKMDDNHRYHHPYYRAKNYNHNRRYDDDHKRLYRRDDKHPYHQNSSSARRNDRNQQDFSYRRSYRHDYHYQQNNSKSYSYYSTPPPPLMAAPVVPLPPPPPPPSLTVVPHERESWIRSVKKTKLNEKSTEEKTQYLETMLRLPQQKSLMKSSRFDRMRFADDQLTASANASTISATTSPDDDNNLDNSSFHFIENISKEEDILTLEKFFFNNEVHTSTSVNDESESVAQNEPISELRSGFLINDCDEEAELPPLSPLPWPPLPRLSISEETSEKNNTDTNEQRVLLVSELDAAESERRQALKRQKRLNQKLRKKQFQPKSEQQQPAILPTVTDNSNPEEVSSSDWIIEYDVNHSDGVSQLTDEVRRTSVAMSDEDRTTKVNLILTKIKKQQDELRKLRQYVLSMLGEQPKVKSSKTHGSDPNLTQDLLFTFLNQPTNSGCWLCSGKMYAEMATQCDHVDEQ